jgi:hypothetical protein
MAKGAQIKPQHGMVKTARLKALVSERCRDSKRCHNYHVTDIRAVQNEEPETIDEAPKKGRRELADRALEASKCVLTNLSIVVSVIACDDGLAYEDSAIDVLLARATPVPSELIKLTHGWEYTGSN